MELLVFGHAGAKVLVFPAREGRFYDYENWGMVNALASSINEGKIQLYCVDSVDSESLYCRWCHPAARIERLQNYQHYLLEEVVPLMRAGGNPFLIAHGCSIGAFHAASLAFRNPGVFGKLVALSGRYDLTRAVGTFADLFDGHHDDNIYFHTPTHFLPALNDRWSLDALRKMQIVLAIGAEDPFLDSTLQFSRQMQEKGIWHEVAVWTGEAHRPRYWRQMVKLYL